MPGERSNLAAREGHRIFSHLPSFPRWRSDGGEAEQLPGLTMPRVSVLVLNWNTRALIRTCLDTLPLGAGDALSFETIVVDNGSIDGSLDDLRAREDILLIENRENRGYAAAVNQAYAASAGEFILLLNSDVELREGSLAVLVRFLDAHSDVAGVGPLYLNPDGSPQQHHFRLPSYGMLLANASRVFQYLPGVARGIRRYRMLDQDFSAPCRVPQPSATMLLLRRSVLPADHLLDESFPIYFNDVELAYRLAQAGHELWMTPESEVFHVHSASTRKLGVNRRRQHLASLIRYLRLTQPTWRVRVYQALVLGQNLILRGLGRPGALPLRELKNVLRGDPGPVPRAPCG